MQTWDQANPVIGRSTYSGNQKCIDLKMQFNTPNLPSHRTATLPRSPRLQASSPQSPLAQRMFTVLLVQSYGLDKPLHRQAHPTAFFIEGMNSGNTSAFLCRLHLHIMDFQTLLLCVPDRSTSVLSSQLSLTGAELVGTNHSNLDSPTSRTKCWPWCCSREAPFGMH